MKIIKEHKTAVGIIITIVISISATAFWFFISSWYSNFMAGPLSDGEKQIIILIIVVTIIILSALGIIFIELREVKKEILNKLKK